MIHVVGKLGIVLLLSLLVQSCEHKELCYDHAHVVNLDIVFDWSEAPYAKPRTMVIQFFRMDGSYYATRELASPAGGKIRIEADKYKVLFHNGEMEFVGEIGDTYTTYELTTKPQSILAPMGRSELNALPPEATANQPVRNIPEIVWGGKLEYVDIQEGKDDQSVTLVPREITTEYTIEVLNVENMSPELDVSGALSSMAECWRIEANKPSGMLVTMPFELQRCYDEKKLIARFASFGHCPDSEDKHTFFIYTSNQTYYDFDVTNQIHDKSSGLKHIHIVIDGLKLPSAEGGMSPSIDGWNDVEDNDIEMN